MTIPNPNPSLTLTLTLTLSLTAAPKPPSEPRRLAAAGFVAAENVTDELCGDDAVRFRWNTRLLPYICPLVARKFGDETAERVIYVLTKARSK